MKKKLLLLAATCATACSPAMAQVGVSVSIGQPGFYGRIDIGDAPQPQVVYPQPVIIERGPVVEQPIYLRVPPGHQKHWSKHCREYDACGRPVYFVQDRWYNNVYVPQYRERHGDHGDNDRRDAGDEHHHGRGRGPGDGPDDDRGPGHDHGHGRDHD